MGGLGLLVGSVLLKSAEHLRKLPKPSAQRTAWVGPARNTPSVAVTSPEYSRPDWSPQITRSEALPVEMSSDDSNARIAVVVIYTYSFALSNPGVRDETEDSSALAHSVSRAEDLYVAEMRN